MPELTLIEPAMLALAAGAALLAGFIRGFTGFGGPAVMLLILTQFYSPLSVLSKVILIDFSANLKLLPNTLKDVDWRMMGITITSSIVGAALGFYAVLVLDALLLKRLIAIVVALCAVLMLIGWRLQNMPGIGVQALAGLVGGLAFGSVYIALVIAIFFFALPGRAATARANMVYWSLPITVALIVGHIAAGSLSFEDIWRSALIGIVYLLATYMGAWFFVLIGERTLRGVVLWLLLFLAVAGLLI